MISSERYSVGSEDGRSISFQKEEGAFVGLDVTIKFKYVIVVIICAVLLLITPRIIFLHLIIPAYWNVYIVYRLTIYYIFMADYIHIVMNLQFWDMEM